MLIGCGREGAGDVTLNDCCVLSCFCYSSFSFFFGLGILNYMIVHNFELFLLFFPGAYPATCNSLDCLFFLFNPFSFVPSGKVILRYRRQWLHILLHYCCLVHKDMF